MSRTARIVRRSIAGLVVSLGITLLIIWLTNIPIATLLKISPLLLMFSLGLSLARLMAQGLRFHILVKRHSSLHMGLGEAFVSRSVSEFFALTTIPFMADEAVRAWMLTERGETPVTALWIAFAELILDVAVAAPIALLAGIAALTHGQLYLSLVLLIIPAAQLTLIGTLIILARRREAARLAEHLGYLGRRLPIIRRALEAFRNAGAESSIFLKGFMDKRSRGPLVALLATTVAVMSIPAVILFAILSSHTSVGFVDALYAFHAGNTLGVLPVTVGGSGLTEAGIYLYSSRVLGVYSWEAVVLWRILTYYLTLILCGVMLLLYTLRSSRRILCP
ncbi:MAG: lysylphosphatidylglycerol synthase domain-containing protein [Nitrososphaerota archaeon]|nr:flippase-like domain-containing protein [Candidatus Calditenuaceae archaeon]MDW8073507.1 lysylphosphatidylglycerol synthase domain-containing protein [Nitrososphaerota archaeon]